MAKEISIDLGTANTLAYMKGKGIIMREPSVVAVDVRTDAVVEVGSKAKDMIGRTPGTIVAVSPLKDGVIADFEITATMLKHFIRQAAKLGRFNRADIIICIPSGVTEVERAINLTKPSSNTSKRNMTCSSASRLLKRSKSRSALPIRPRTRRTRPCRSRAAAWSTAWPRT